MTPLELWAGIECSLVRVRDRFVDQVELTGHDARPEDLERLAALGVRAVRYPVLWERVQPDPSRAPDWSFSDERLGRLRELGLRPIVGLVHHGSGPRHTSLLSESFVSGLTEYAARVAERYPWVLDFTPVNEPLTTARFSALYGHWYPHRSDSASFFRALLVECRAIAGAMRAIRSVQPEARLVQTEDFGTVFASEALAYQAEFENHRRFLSLDLLTGRVDPSHVLWRHLEENGVGARELEALAAEPCPPDVIGLNHYVTSDRYLDDRTAHYPADRCGGNGRHAYADVEAVRAVPGGIPGFRAHLETLWARYGRPLAITEAHMGCTPEEQIRWLVEAWEGASAARAAGVDVRAVTAWSVFGATDWNSLLTEARGHYEPGLFDVRGGAVRSTALARVAQELASRGASDHPLLGEPGWWRRDDRVLYPPAPPPAGRAPAPRPRGRPRLLVTGGAGTLGRAIERVGTERGLQVIALTRRQLDITDPGAISAMLEEYRPWAVINAAGYVRVDDAEHDESTCMRVNAEAAALLAEACRRRGARYATFSSDLVFDGTKGAAYVESDVPNPLGVYGRSKQAAERLVGEAHPNALVVRTSAFFGPWDTAHFLHHALTTIRAGGELRAAADTVVSPTWVPELAAATITLLVDGASGVWHLATPGAVTWFELARRVATLTGLPADAVVPCSMEDLALVARRPRASALRSARGELLRPLDEALELWASAWLAQSSGRGGARRAP